MFGVIGDLISGGINQMWADERQEDSQQHNTGEAAANRAWQERMSNTAVRRHADDLRAAGFNPLLAAGGNQASTPSGAVGSAGTASPGHTPSLAAAYQSAAQVELIQAETDKVRAEAKEIEERTKNYEPTRREIEARIPTHKAQADNLIQQTGESAVRIEKLWEETRVASATATNVAQQTTNLKEMVNQIRAQVSNLQALSAQASAATDEIKQRVRANLPELQAILQKLEATSRRMAQPGQAAAEAAADSLVGQIGAYLRAINPLKGFLNAAH